MRKFILQSLRWYSKTPSRRYQKAYLNFSRSISQEFDFSSKHSTPFNSSNPGWFPPHVWLVQRNGNETLKNALFPSTSRSHGGSEFISTGVAHISGKPVDQNIRYDTVENFTDLNVDKKLLSNVAMMNLSRMTPIQRHAIPLLLLNSKEEDITSPTTVGLLDMMAAAQTGSGKTLAYLLPTLSRMMSSYPVEAMNALADSNYTVQYPTALILAPTRELVNQIRMEASKLCYRTYIRPVALFGGERPDRQVNEVGRGCHLTIATPGRLLDFLDRQLLNLSHCRTLIIDEADRLLDMGFEPQLRKVLQSPAYGMPPAEDNQRQTALFSATFPREVALLARDFLRGPSCVSLNVVPQEQQVEGAPQLVAPAWGEAVRRPSSAETLRQLKASVPREIIQSVEWIDSDVKLDRLKRLTAVINRITQEHLEAVAAKTEAPTNITRVLVFCNTKHEADMVDHYLTRQSTKSVCVHGGRSQYQRTQGVRLFREGHVNILVATSVAARGLDFPSVKAVINYSLPLGLDDYVHRIGRTGRMGSAGLAVTLVSPEELRREPHLQQVARGVCTLINQGADSADSIPSELIKAVRWHKGQDVEDAPTSFKRQVPCPPSRLNTFRHKRSYGQGY